MAVVKGKALIGQSGGPTCVINQSLLGIIEELRFYEEVDAIWGARFGVKGILKEDFIDLGKETTATLRAVAGTPGAGRIHLLFEGGPRGAGSAIQAAVFNLSWLLGGEKTGDGEVPEWIDREERTSGK